MGAIRLGCSGWDYDEWVGPLYASRSGSKLHAYGRVFDTVEINSTFYRAPTPGMVLGWARYSPDDFMYAAKVPQTVTHDRLLKVESGADRVLQEYCDLMRPLLDAGKLGPLLLQLPPRLGFDAGRTQAFFEALPPEFVFAIEFRNRSWMRPEALALLQEHQVVYTVVDEPLLPPEVHVTAPIAYFRWHGHGSDPWYNYRYERPQLEPWVPKLQEVASQARTVFGYFNNHFHGYAPENCLQVLEMLGALKPEQHAAQRRLREFRRGIVRSAHGRVRTTTLEDFGGASPAGSPTGRLEKLTTRTRLERAKSLATDVVLQSAEDPVAAQVGRYLIQIDEGGRQIAHDCEDWRKHLDERQLCKHVVALLLALPSQQRRALLEDLHTRREDWRFEDLERTAETSPPPSGGG